MNLSIYSSLANFSGKECKNLHSLVHILKQLYGFSIELLLEQIPERQLQRQLNAALPVALFKNWSSLFGGCDLFTVFYLLRNGADAASMQCRLDSLLQKFARLIKSMIINIGMIYGLS
jgi:hypothetical protein